MQTHELNLSNKKLNRNDYLNIERFLTKKGGDLVLNHCSITGEDFFFIFSNEKINLNLLSLKGNNLKDNDIMVLAKILSRIEVTTLDLSKNDISIIGLWYLLKSLKHTKILNINLSYNLIEKGVGCLLSELLNKDLKKITLEGNKIIDDDIKILLNLCLETMIEIDIVDKYIQSQLTQFQKDSIYLDHWKAVMHGNKLPKNTGTWVMSEKVKTFNEFDGKQVLAFFRDGDYTHAGEEAAIDVMMSGLSKNASTTILDVASGLGGSASYIQKSGFGIVTGFDIEEATIEYAKQKYPEVEFLLSDVIDAHKLFNKKKFDIICIINSLVCFPKQVQSLQSLRHLAKENTKLIILEYVDNMPKGQNPLVINGPKNFFLPIRLDEIDYILNKSGWEKVEYINLDHIFKDWYDKFLKYVESKRMEADNRFYEGATDFVIGKYSTMYDSIKYNLLGGCIISAKAIN